MDRDKKNWRGTREGFGEGLVILGERNPKIVVLSADLAKSTRAYPFKERFADRFFEFGVAEQNMMGVAAGLSLTGYIPYVCTYGIFSSGRCWEQLRTSVCYNNCNVKIEGAHSGLLVGPDGATHQATEDIAAIRAIPNLKIVVPADSVEARKATIAAADISGPIYLRFGREPTPIVTNEDYPFILGKANIIREGKDVAVIACGVEVSEALLAAEEMEKEGIEICVVNLHTIKPIDEETIINIAKKTGAIVTAEEHQIFGGLGGAVAEVLSKNYPVPIEMVGIRDKFGESGQPYELLEEFGLTSSGIIRAIRKVLERKKKE